MEFEKKVVVLKQLGKGFSADGSVLSGAVYAERLGRELTLKIQTAGLSALKEGRYVGVFSAGEVKYCFPLSGREQKLYEAPSLKEGFSFLIAFVRGEAQPVAFGSCGSGQKGSLELLAAITENPDKKSVPIPPVEVPLISPSTPGSPLVPPIPELPQEPQPPAEEAPRSRASFREGAIGYDDEAIAQTDYFNPIQKGDGHDPSSGEEKEPSGQVSGGAHSQKDDGALHPFLRTQGKLTYYKKIRERLEKAFSSYPADTRLLGVFPRSEWVRTENALLGIVYENGLPRYLCVASEKSGDPPADMKEHCVFVPESPFSEERGFYVVFQDADTGDYVSVAQN